MNLSEREELRLVLLRDASVGHFMWLDRWQVSYPQVIAAECSAHEALIRQNQRLQAAIEPEQDFPLFIVAHGAACAAALSIDSPVTTSSSAGTLAGDIASNALAIRESVSAAFPNASMRRLRCSRC